MGQLPQDPIMLYSVINTKLRDFYSSLEVLCEDMGLSEEELKDAVTVENGIYTFRLKHMEKIEMTIPYGVEYIVSEEPEDYDVQITKKVSEEEEQKLDNGKKELSDMLSENTDLTFTNTKEVEPATGIRQTSAPYMVMTGAAFGMLAFFGLVYGIRKWGDPTGE